MTVKLTLALSDSDRTRQLMSGGTTLQNYILEPQTASVEDIFVKQISEAVYDVAELSLASYLIALSRGETRLTAIPVFLSRSFRHNAIYVRTDSAWNHPSQLRGRRFGFPEFQMTAAVWIRAYFREEWGIANDEIEWVTYRPERIPIETPAVRAPGGDLFAALAAGEVDAIMSARRPPERYFPKSGEGGVIRRLFPDVWNVEREYYKRTGIFPIMHLVSVKKEVAEAHPELPLELYKCLSEHKDAGIAQLLETVKNQTSAPWLWESVEQAIAFMGTEIWPYGMASNWPQIEQFMGFLQADGLIRHKLAPEQVFHPAVITT